VTTAECIAMIVPFRAHARAYSPETGLVCPVVERYCPP
jgi:hypothetical protein